jgi:hypothetical protein
MLKLAMIVYRRHVIARVAMGQNNRVQKNPIMESLVLVTLAVGIDFIFVMWINNNQVPSIHLALGLGILDYHLHNHDGRDAEHIPDARLDSSLLPRQGTYLLRSRLRGSTALPLLRDSEYHRSTESVGR